MFNLGFSEIILISIIALIFIGPKQLPEIARALGRALNELKRATEDLTSTVINPKNYSQHDLTHKSDLPPIENEHHSKNHEESSINNKKTEDTNN